MKRLSVLATVLLVATGVIVEGQSVRPLLPVSVAAEAPQPAAADALAGIDAFFDDSVLHEIRLDINSRDWQALKDHYRENTYYPSDFRWRDQVVRNIGIRSRGQGSRSGVKPALRVDFNRYTTGQTFYGRKSVVLRNNTQDASNMRERLSMALFTRMGIPASREAFAKLYVNNSYAGLYTIVEPVDKDFLQENFGENEGYLFNYQYAGAYYMDDRGTDQNTYVPLPFQPETHENDPHAEAIVDLVQTVNHAVDFAGQMAQYLDLRRFIRHVAVETFLADYDDFVGDFGMNNFYIYRFQNKNQFILIPWDKSQAFSSPTFSIWHNIRDVSGGQTNRLMARALELPELYTLYLDTLVACVDSIREPGETDARGWLEREIDRENQQIREAVLIDPQKDYTNEQYDGEVNKLMEFARMRGDFVTNQVNAAR